MYSHLYSRRLFITDVHAAQPTKTPYVHPDKRHCKMGHNYISNVEVSPVLNNVTYMIFRTFRIFYLWWNKSLILSVTIVSNINTCWWKFDAGCAFMWLFSDSCKWRYLHRWCTCRIAPKNMGIFHVYKHMVQFLDVCWRVYDQMTNIPEPMSKHWFKANAELVVLHDSVHEASFIWLAVVSFRK